ncbi:MAG: hydantoinase B/oxoprolinase family protein [Pseudobdellovibrionaceae bacterium]
MNLPLKLSELQSGLARIFSQFEMGALVTLENETIFVKYETLPDIGTLPQAAQICQAYLKLQEGDMALLNDPYSGGTVLSMMTLVTPVKLASGMTFLLVHRLGFRPRLSLFEKLDEEGLRIPPTPLVQNHQINESIFSAIESHPFCPQGFGVRLRAAMTRTFQAREQLKVLFQNLSPGPAPQKEMLKNYFKHSKEIVQIRLDEWPSGETKVELSSDRGDTIQLQMALSDNGLNLNFRGTSPSKKTCLTESATFGACFGAFKAFLGGRIPVNHGSFSFLHLSTPLGCLLNAKYPSPTFKGMTDGSAMVAATVMQGLGKIVTHLEMGQGASTLAKLELCFKDGSRFYDVLPGGAGATSQGPGADGLSYWVRDQLQPSVEEIEKRFPILIRKIGVRAGSAGKGHHSGGQGLFKQYELLQDAHLSWLLEQTKHKPQGVRGGQAGSIGEIFVSRKGEAKKELLNFEGSIDLKAGDKIILHSAGGGGWGSFKEAADDKT